MVIDAAMSPWCLKTYLEMVAATGCRRGEMLALRWSDIQDGRAMIARSLSQARDALTFKSTKTEEPRPVSLPVSAIAALDDTTASARMRVGASLGQSIGPTWT